MIRSRRGLAVLLVVLVAAFDRSPEATTAQTVLPLPGECLFPSYEQVRAYRHLFGRVVHIYGDSIAGGYARGRLTPEPGDPLICFTYGPTTAMMALRDNGIADQVVFAANVIGGTERRGIQPLQTAVAEGTIRPGDVIVFEDAGEHHQDPDRYEAEWLALRAAATAQLDVLVIMMTMFDYEGAPPGVLPEYQYDRPFGPSGRTMNDATRAAATASLNAVGRTVLIDLDESMDRARERAMALDGVDIILPDGVHPNVWGQLRVVGEILKAAGYRLDNVETIVSLVRKHHRNLAYGSTTFDPDRAEFYARWMLRP